MTEPTQEEELHSHLLGYLDETGGTISALLDAIDAVEEDGEYASTEPIRENVESASGYYSEAFNGVDSENPDPGEIASRCTAARNALSAVLGDIEEAGMEEFVLPNSVASGVYDTLGEYADYCYRDALGIEELAENYELVAG